MTKQRAKRWLYNTTFGALCVIALWLLSYIWLEGAVQVVVAPLGLIAVVGFFAYLMGVVTIFCVFLKCIWFAICLPFRLARKLKEYHG